jgi:hypothetical protein
LFTFGALVIFAAWSDILPVFLTVVGWFRSVCLLAALPGFGVAGLALRAWAGVLAASALGVLASMAAWWRW